MEIIERARPVSRTELGVHGEAWRAALESDDARTIAESYKHTGGQPMHQPWVREIEGGYELLTGLHRLAAFKLTHDNNDDTPIEVTVVKCSNLEAQILKRVENAARRHDKNEQNVALLELVSLFEKEEEKKIRDHAERYPLKKVPVGRPKSARGRARERAAEMTGITEGAVRKAEQRAKKAKPKKKDWVPNTYGMELSDQFVAECRAIRTYLKDTRKRLSMAMQALDNLKRSTFDYPADQVQEVYESVLAGSERMAEIMPDALCPYCKGIQGLQESCGVCGGRGWVGKLKDVPRELLDEETPHVVVKGEPRPVTEVLGEPEPEELEGDEDDEAVRDYLANSDNPLAAQHVSRGERPELEDTEGQEMWYDEDELDGDEDGEADLPW